MYTPKPASAAGPTLDGPHGEQWSVPILAINQPRIVPPPMQTTCAAFHLSCARILHLVRMDPQTASHVADGKSRLSASQRTPLPTQAADYRAWERPRMANQNRSGIPSRALPRVDHSKRWLARLCVKKIKSQSPRRGGWPRSNAAGKPLCAQRKQCRDANNATTL